MDGRGRADRLADTTVPQEDVDTVAQDVGCRGRGSCILLPPRLRD